MSRLVAVSRPISLILAGSDACTPKRRRCRFIAPPSNSSSGKARITEFGQSWEIERGIVQRNLDVIVLVFVPRTWVQRICGVKENFFEGNARSFRFTSDSTPVSYVLLL